MMMKKCHWIFIAALLAVCACSKDVSVQEEPAARYSLSELRFDFTIERPVTKGVRSGWQNGDKVFIFFAGVSSGYVTLTHDGSAWGDAVPTGTAALDRSGILTAVYLPYGNESEPSFSGGAWIFPGSNDFYFLRAEKADYYITDMENQVSTLGAYLTMENADEFVQLFVPDDTEDKTLRMACNVLVPAGLSAVSLDASVTEFTGVSGGWMTGHADTIDAEKGYYFSGKLAFRPGAFCYFALEGSGQPRDYCKLRSSTLLPRGAYQLPALGDWHVSSASDYVTIGGIDWCAANYGATAPWELGTACASGSVSVAVNADSHEDAAVPTDDDWTLLRQLNVASWYHVSVAGVGGFVVMDRKDSSKYIYLPCSSDDTGSAYWSAAVGEAGWHSFKINNNGIRRIDTGADQPSEALVRLVLTNRYGSFNPPEDGGEI